MKGINRMMDAEPPCAAPADASSDHERTIRVKADPGPLFDALTGVSGLAAWWTRVTGSGEAGGELRFFMNSPEPLVIQVDQATPADIGAMERNRMQLSARLGWNASDLRHCPGRWRRV